MCVMCYCVCVLPEEERELQAEQFFLASCDWAEQPSQPEQLPLVNSRRTASATNTKRKSAIRIVGMFI